MNSITLNMRFHLSIKKKHSKKNKARILSRPSHQINILSIHIPMPC